MPGGRAVRVRVPQGLRSGQSFQAQVPGSGLVTLRVPAGKKGGDVIDVSVGPQIEPFKSCLRTHVVQRSISNLMAASEVFHQADDDPTDDIDDKAIVLIPEDPCGLACPRFCFSVPSGMWILKQHCGRDVGLELPGFKLAWWGWDKISHVVTRSTVSYSTPVKQCPTADNVRVEIDVSLNFQIGPTIKDARRFVYELGAARFDELLGAEIEEAVREMVFQVKALRIHDLREEFADGMLRGLNRTMRKFGVEMKNVKITGVKLPESLERALQSKTQFKSQMDEAATKQTLRMIQLNDDYDKKIQNTLRQNMRGVQDLIAAQSIALTDREREMAKQSSAMDVAIVNSRGSMTVAVTKADGQKAISEAQALESANALVERVKADKNSRVVAVDQEFSSAVTRAKAQLAVAQGAAAEIDADADAEAEASVRLAVIRNHEVKELRIAALRRISASAKVIVGGASGEGLLAQIAPGSHADLSRD